MSLKTVLSKLPSAAAAVAAAVADALRSPSPPTEVIAAVFQVKSEIISEIITPIKSKQMMKGNSIGFSDVDDGDSMISDDFDSDECIDISDIKPKVKFLPSKDYASDFAHCRQNSYDKENTSTETKLWSFWMSYYDKRL